jgi:hypothetical protein
VLTDAAADHATVWSLSTSLPLADELSFAGGAATLVSR